MMVLAALLVALSAQADTYYWNKASGGYWDEPGNWVSSSGAGTYPGEIANEPIGTAKVDAPYTITLRKNERTSNWTFGISGTGFQTVDLGGHFLNCAYFQFWGSSTPSDYNVFPNKTVEFRNGSAFMGNNINIGYSHMVTPGVLVFTDCIATGSFENVGLRSAFVVRDGAKFVFNKAWDTIKFPNENQTAEKAFFTVTGANSRVEMPYSALKLQNVRTGLFLFEGASASIKDLLVGPTEKSNGNFADIRGATLEVAGGLCLGADNATSKNSTLLVSGSAAKVSASTLTVYEGEACVLDLTIPTAGFDKVASADVAPLQFGAVTLVPRADGNEDFGAFVFKISCNKWMNANSEKTIPLVTLAEPDAEALAALVDAVEWTDVPPAFVEAGRGPVLSLSADNTTLLITAPAINYNPAFAVTTQAGDAVGQKKFVIALSDYGAGASSITSVALKYTDNPDFTGSTVVDLLNGTPVTAPVPCELVYAVDGGFAQHGAYYARVTLTNEGGHEETVETVFSGDGVSETLSWVGANVDGVWQDVGNWKINGVAAGQYPHEEDTVLLGGGAGITTLTLADDVTVKRFGGTATYPDVSSGRWTVDLNGHALEIATSKDWSATIGGGGPAATGMDLSPVGATLVFRDGTLKMPAVAGNYGFVVGAVSLSYSGTLVFDNVTAKARIAYFDNSSRIFVCNGSRLVSPDEIKFATHTALSAYSALCVTGASSRVEIPSTKQLVVRGRNSALYVLDGGAVSCGTCWIGMKGAVESGDISSDCTLVKVDDGTITTTGDLNIGWPENVKLSPKLAIGGTNGAVTVGATLNIYEKLGGEIEFALPPAGYKTTPLKANSLAFVARTAGYTDYGAMKLSLTGVRDWARLHPKETIELVKLTTPNAEGLAALKASATVDWTKLGSSALAVSADGTALTLTAPARSGLAIIFR